MDGNPDGKTVPAPIGFEGQDLSHTTSNGVVGETHLNKTFEDGQVKKKGTEPDNVEVNIADEPEASLFFRDGIRRIDFVMVFKEDDDPEEEGKRKARRDLYQSNLEKKGLEIEISVREDEKTTFVKLHVPWEVLARYAEILNMKMPLAENDIMEIQSCWEKFPNPFGYNDDILPDEPDYFTAPFSRARMNQGSFIIKEKKTFFSPAQRSLICHQVMSSAVFEDYGDSSKNKFGIKRLLSNGTYEAAYPLHSGPYKSEHSLLTRGSENNRHLLFETWARPGTWYKFQPLDHIRHYFGEKIAIYFSWLGYYTGLLIPAGILGLIIFIYGLATVFTNVPSEQICDKDGLGNLTMCPLCDKRCSYWKLIHSCMYSRVTYLFDNTATMVFAAFMALWATFFSEMWKRRSAEIEYDWDVADFEEEETIRPEFEAAVRRRKVNPINKLEEPYVSFFSRTCRKTSSVWVVVFMLCVVIAAVFGVIVYRITIIASLYAVNDTTVKQRASTITSVTAACLNLVLIIVLGKVYQIIAKVLTNFELHRTLTEWEDSFTLKMFLFQSVNHYASLFYIAFFKGKFVGRPGDYNRELSGARQEECDPSGCLIELCIQLAVIMIGKQAFNNFKELILPKLMNWFRARKILEAEEKNKEKVTQWEKDYTMTAMPDLGLFDEYLEMVIQYGFVTLFVASFPLAPLFALINNVIEVRLDAYKFVAQYRRTLAMRAQDIGIWFGILQGVSEVSIMTNAVLVAFTSDFIPKLVYRYQNGYSLDGYMNFTLSVFNVSDFEADSIPDDPKVAEFGNLTYCRYRGFRDPPGAEDPYALSLDYWHILAGRLAFIIVFVIAVHALAWIIAYLVPDIPKAVKLQMMREKYLSREAALAAEALTENGGRVTSNNANTEMA